MSGTVIVQPVRQWLNNQLSGFDSRRCVYFGQAQPLAKQVKEKVFNEATKNEA
jgi:predicted ATP-grasp superfamily ATP-dependent carboligase